MEGVINNLFYYTGMCIWGVVCLILALALLWYLREVIFLTYKVIKCPFRMTKEGSSIRGKLALYKWILVEAGSSHGTMEITKDGHKYYFYGEKEEQKRLQEYHERWGIKDED